MAAHIQTGAVQQGAAGAQVWPVAAHQATQSSGRWLLDHVTSISHVAGTLHVVNSLSGGALTCHSTAAISMSASGIVAHASGLRLYVCSISLVASAAVSLGVVSGTGASCGTLTWPFIGGHVAASGLSLAANSGLVQGTGTSPIFVTPLNTYNLCVLISGTARVAGIITYGGAP